jgi:hypothetical protein
MSIKNLGPNANSNYNQGYFDRFNPKKYEGPRPIIYRSSLELRFMRNLELNADVLSWSSENISIPYILKEKHGNTFREIRKNYHIDFTVNMKNSKKYVVEVKPSCFVPMNESEIRLNPVIYKNACKWKYAIQWCKLNGYEFKIVTEKNLSFNIK